MEEFDFIRSIKPDYYRQSSVIKGIGDDAAIIRYPYQDIITTVDTMVENVHFSAKTTEPFHIGYRALAANISDIAAMGGQPTAYLVSIVIPDHWQLEAVQSIYQGMNQLARTFQMDLIGGDTVSGEQLSLSITVLGLVSADKVRYRSTAQPGDLVFVTGTLGDSACGLHILLNESLEDHSRYQYFISRHQKPVPRVDFIQACQAIGRMSLNDISDGIASEANEIAETSQVQIELDYHRIPTHKKLADFSEEQQKDWSLSGGEDFELIGTIAEQEVDKLQQAAVSTQTKLSIIGRVTSADQDNYGVWLRERQAVRKLDPTGYTHLRR
ncbi:thiamine-phosphate kinase [Gracilibacillus alcaliphilus]|uniref:thiamine-phosphate kinase n=1 Tax=Gracilibacillus alcaliphilus TaxID=1401441 RepID=UPI001958C82F|nr:thiamine-phosphate kinase [Gracilibacillus alcaliphilus]MBM7679626.1 thiamine-monophosphate kinase [Gracilibacillus alcaliphilus]